MGQWHDVAQTCILPLADRAIDATLSADMCYTRFASQMALQCVAKMVGMDVVVQQSDHRHEVRSSTRHPWSEAYLRLVYMRTPNSQHYCCGWLG